ncbi:MAG: 5-nitroimidazole antibiotic resistance protein [Provencibacterium sp.]|jgi:nitroimidazol reductase NimA-like FMN-containing flavoprotein (pyridoxamine 5'-phosphate oxidase superfamily)|nr:5-nitroimidazole antibiotic resistance protein [Provencibacterium sp.]
MFREMRRKNQQLSQQENRAVLQRGTSGVLALLGDGGYPYAVPLSYACEEGKIYFHWALSGHKLDAVLKENRASFCVIDKDEVVPEKFTTYFRSVIAFGRIHILEQEAEKRRALEMLAEKYSPEVPEAEREKEISRFWDSVCIAQLSIEHLSGKQGRELCAQSGEKQ